MSIKFWWPNFLEVGFLKIDGRRLRLIKLSSDGGDVDWILAASRSDIMADLCARREDRLHSNSQLDC
jgi:hypothetical protein